MYYKIKQINVNTSMPIPVLFVRAEEKTTRTGSTYLTMTLTDGETIITANKWDTTLEQLSLKEEELITADIAVRPYNGGISYTVNSIGPAPAGAKIDEFIKTVPIDRENAFNEMIDMTFHIKDESLRMLVQGVLNSFKTEFSYWSAAKSVHHNLFGGLLYHTYRMSLTAFKVCEIYTKANLDLVLAGVMLHDIGKLKELSTTKTGNATYTVEGNLFGHSLIGIQMIDSINRENNYGVSEETLMQLYHILASHHGQLEYGAITKPATLEAFLVNQIDMIDSHAYQYEETTEGMEPGTMSDRVFGLNNTCVYKPF